ncbi:LOW QUALITY PROTEIN: N(6)-adenine-specific DNA methyltransferase 2 [Phytophthora megakarya]|uniref:N(6)-adenine-specific DNA methyltransferase 2 n=1 Tax=Phytophthora megakarya TaxID=4795 RepID=A0A225W561_9STRA|nr:LOW QUALITY PROTEIN: N(6)-adenine-specific DNA methyltransferase 2 [Phytophthora megakarya]
MHQPKMPLHVPSPAYTDLGVAVQSSATVADASGSEANSADQYDYQDNSKKKFYFTAENDLNLLREILSARPYASKHGTVTSRYNDVASNLNEHGGTELAMRTVKKRVFLLKSGVAEDYAEIKQCLQDITDEMRDIAESKNLVLSTDTLAALQACLLERHQEESAPVSEDLRLSQFTDSFTCTLFVSTPAAYRDLFKIQSEKEGESMSDNVYIFEYDRRFG